MWSSPLKFIFICSIFALLTACQSSAPETPKPEPVTAPQTEAETASSGTPSEEVEQDPSDELFQKAMKNIKENNTDQAIEQFQQLVFLNPSYEHAFTNLGLIYLNDNEDEYAKNALLQAIEQDNNDSIAYNHLAIIERRKGSFKKSLFYYNKAINSNPDYANAHLNLGILFDLYLQDLSQALKHYKTYMDLTDHTDKKIEKWVIDIQRRIDADKKS